MLSNFHFLSSPLFQSSMATMAKASSTSNLSTTQTKSHTLRTLETQNLIWVLLSLDLGFFLLWSKMRHGLPVPPWNSANATMEPNTHATLNLSPKSTNTLSKPESLYSQTQKLPSDLKAKSILNDAWSTKMRCES